VLAKYQGESAHLSPVLLWPVPSSPFSALINSKEICQPAAHTNE